MKIPENLKNAPIGTRCWHIHHDTLYELLEEPAENRWYYILANKPQGEIETRLKLFRPMTSMPSVLSKAHSDYCKAHSDYCEACSDYGKACSDYGKAHSNYGKAYSDYGKACSNYGKARSDWNNALEDNRKELETLHKIECPNCPWNGKTIFP